MAEFPALPLWTDAYLGDTTHLTTIEHGAYLLLLITAWRTADCALPDDDRLLARYARCGPNQWKRLRPIIQPFFTVENGQWTQRRLTDERVAVKRHRELASEKGKRGAEAKALKNKGRHSAQAKPGLPPAEAEVQPDASSLLLLHSSDTNVSGAEGAADPDPDKVFWANAKAALQPFCKGDPGKVVGQWLRDNGKDLTVAALNAAQLERAVNPIEYCQGYFRRNRMAKPKSGNPDDGYLDHVLAEREKVKAFEERQAAAGNA